MAASPPKAKKIRELAMTVCAWRIAAASMLLVLAGCGGGGGGDGSTEPSADGAALDLSKDRASQGSLSLQVGAQTSAMGAQLLGLAQFGIDMAHRFARPGGPASVTAACAGAGSITLTLTDRDGNGVASAGDVINATLDDCGVPILMRTASGALQVEVLSGSASTITTDAQVRITAGTAGLALTRRPNTAATYALPPATLFGSLTARWTDSETAQQLQATSAAADDLRLASIDANPAYTDTVSKIAVMRSTRYDSASTGTSMAFIYDMGQLGGRVLVSSDQAIGGRSNATPTAGAARVGLAAGQHLSVQPAITFGFSELQVRLLSTATGAVAFSGVTLWGGEHAALTWDGRTQVGATYPTWDGYTGDYASVALDTYPSPTAELDDLCNPTPAAGVSNFRADALFLHPVAPTPGSASAALAVRWQSGAALAETQPAFKFRFIVDPSSTLGGIEDPPPVAATAVRYGALYVIRPAESLRHDARYWLQASPDGVDWTSSITRQLADGTMSLFGSTLAAFGTSKILVAGIAIGDRAVPSASRPATLQATVKLGGGQSVASYEWTQVSGPAVAIATPNAANTMVAYSDAASRPAELVTMQLKVTDSFGEVERIRTHVMVGDHLPGNGALLYADKRNSSTDAQMLMGMAAGGVERGAEPGSLILRLEQPVVGTGTTSFSLVPADQQPLRVGTYEAALPSHIPGVQNGIEGLLLVGDCLSGLTGSFTVLEVTYASDGSVSRLAVDLQQSCQAFSGVASHNMSFRYNSSLPIRP
jgi:hypothetical protein